ncbi:hypothetical protein [Streptomyces muensis]|uniref:Uncharacterized protein n=1 Tax=Streptomyces muensis TaxID=1077944 RepID=A0A9X1Q670_STRM4|nr:hypothetical protein [Streptomyces muensis]MCF1598664.1 hypothetical protein [Streptomyces muensis]
MRERTAGLMKPLLIALVRVLLPSRGRHRAAPPQPPLITRPLPAPPCRCERERILQQRRIHWAAAYGTNAVPRRTDEAEVFV